ncbi:transcriptional repressor LexA [Ferrimicrobium acidiphilum]|uniref:LexA repressor n=1 Tax=Ferrimicrobium acidiphilum DSM 19497 TaxID=1121877 RepID=A0A0D8FVT6_9ACTN|nr:transcriptional repressor LexA [Ferrimicrobium acidiphilum]KJE77390.1 LexA repressor [Ferrimicrobium acidiphilum DSM 19497]
MPRTNDDVRIEIVSFLKETLDQRGYPPSIREIGAHVGLSSPASVQHHLRRLEADGLIHRDPTRSRAISLSNEPPRAIEIPLLASVGAGYSVVAETSASEMLAVPSSMLGSGDHFALQVRGDSMIDAGIFDGDFAIVRQQPDANDGDIVIATVDDQFGTIKVLRKVGNRVLLEARNRRDPNLQIPSEITQRGRVQGKVIALWRNL